MMNLQPIVGRYLDQLVDLIYRSAYHVLIRIHVLLKGLMLESMYLIRNEIQLRSTIYQNEDFTSDFAIYRSIREPMKLKSNSVMELILVSELQLFWAFKDRFI